MGQEFRNVRIADFEINRFIEHRRFYANRLHFIIIKNERQKPHNKNT